MKRIVGDIRKRQEKVRVPKDYRIKRSCCRKIAVRENLRNLEKLARKKCVLVMCCLVIILCTDTHVQPV
jgi:hypothetical protein